MPNVMPGADPGGAYYPMQNNGMAQPGYPDPQYPAGQAGGPYYPGDGY
jgi:hypothetical protein